MRLMQRVAGNAAAPGCNGWGLASQTSFTDKPQNCEIRTHVTPVEPAFAREDACVPGKKRFPGNCGYLFS